LLAERILDQIMAALVWWWRSRRLLILLIHLHHCK